MCSRLSANASIRTNTSSAARWSDYYAPEAQVLVNVAEEQDVAQTVSTNEFHRCQRGRANTT